MTEKIKNQQEIALIVKELKNQGKKVVWTNGCFDILHIGHIKYLQEAKSKGDILIVGLNSDTSVKAIKGPKRPIINQSQRALVLSALLFVDYILIFDQPSPAYLLEILQPDVFVKGGDYSLQTLNPKEREAVENYGGEIALIKFVENASTTEIIKKILSIYGGKN